MTFWPIAAARRYIKWHELKRPRVVVLNVFAMIGMALSKPDSSSDGGLNFRRLCLRGDVCLVQMSRLKLTI